MDHQLNGHEFEQAPGGGDGLGSLACCSSWGRKELDVTERLNNNGAFQPSEYEVFRGSRSQEVK